MPGRIPRLDDNQPRCGWLISPHVSGFVIRELSPVVSNWRADWTLSDYLERAGIPGIQGIDTRALTKKLRVRGAMNGFISTEAITAEEAVARAKNWPGLAGVDYVKEVADRPSAGLRGQAPRACVG